MQIWLTSMGNVAVRLHVTRLTGNPITLPLAVLLEPIGVARDGCLVCTVDVDQREDWRMAARGWGGRKLHPLKGRNYSGGRAYCLTAVVNTLSEESPMTRLQGEAVQH